MSMNKFQEGFTMGEVLIVVAIICLLSTLVLINLRGQIARGNDAKRKIDLNTLSKFFEDYYNDHGAFPDQSVVNDCGGTIDPYIKRIPCDPVSRAHYGYFPLVSGGYRICATLSDTTDPSIAAMGCGGDAGCGLGGPPSGGVYNYCLASGVTASAVDGSSSGGATPTPTGSSSGGATPTPTGSSSGGGTPTPTLHPGWHIVCTKGGACNTYVDPAAHGCPIVWKSACPGYIHSPETPFSGACADSANRCTD
jgi:prepilin-type N-terminal cleavage/methylation domain-containing protein